MVEQIKNAKLVDVVRNGSTPMTVYVQDSPDICNVTRIGRFVDKIKVDLGSGGIQTLDVYTVVSECSKNWEEEVEFFVYDLGNGISITMPREILLYFEDMTECTAGGNDCEEETLFYDEIEQRWKGSITWNTGLNGSTVDYEFYGYTVVNPDLTITVVWELLLLGCMVSSSGGIGLGEPTPDGYIQQFDMICEHPLAWTSTFDPQPYGYYNCCCNTPFSPPNVYLFGKIDPVFNGRFVDYVDDKPVYAVTESCPECPCNPSCCPGTPFDSDTDFTVFNVVQTGAVGPFPENCGDCVTLDVDDDDPLIPGNSYPLRACRMLFFEAGCFTGASVCVYCVPGGCGSGTEADLEPEERWQNYRLVMQQTLPLPVPDDYDLVREPTSGTCNPFSVTFTNLPYRVETSGAMCEGTFSLTVTRSGCA